MLIYVSALIAMGFSPLVRVIERPGVSGRRACPAGSPFSPSTSSSSRVFVLVGLLVIPPLVAQAAALWAKLPTEFNRFQTFLIRHKLMTHRVTLEEAVQNAPAGTGGNAVGTRARRDLEPDRRRLRPDHDPDPELLSAASKPSAMFEYLDAVRAGRPPRRCRDRGARSGHEGERVAARAVHPRRRDGHVRGGRSRR